MGGHIHNDSNVSGCYRYLLKNSVEDKDITSDSHPPIRVTIRAPTNIIQESGKDSRYAGVISVSGRKFNVDEAAMLFGLTHEQLIHERRSQDYDHLCGGNGSAKRHDIQDSPPTRRKSWAEACEFTPRSSLRSSPGTGEFSEMAPVVESSAMLAMAFQMGSLMQQNQQLLEQLSMVIPRIEMTQPQIGGYPETPAQFESGACRTANGLPSSFYGPQPPLSPFVVSSPPQRVQVFDHRRNRSFGSESQKSPPRRIGRTRDQLRSPMRYSGSPIKEINQRNLREIFAFIQDKLEYFVRGFVCFDVSYSLRVEGNEALVRRCHNLIGNRQTSIHALQQPELHGALVIGLIWQMTSVLLFGDGLMNHFPSEHSLDFAEAWAMETKERNNTVGAANFAQLEKLEGNRARIAKQIVKISGFWSEWRIDFSTNLTGQIMAALDQVFHPGNKHQASIQLRDIVQKMLDVAVRLRQESSSFLLHFPQHGDRFNPETMVGCHVNGRPWVGSLGRPTVLFANSPCLVENKIIEGQTMSETHYKSECLIRERASM